MCIQNPAKHLRWSCMVKKVNNLKPLTLYSKKLFDSLMVIMELSSTIIDSHNQTLVQSKSQMVTSIILNNKQGRIWNPVEHLRWGFFAKIVNYFCKKNSIIDVRLGSKYVYDKDIISGL